jgi:hypothetical protein
MPQPTLSLTAVYAYSGTANLMIDAYGTPVNITDPIWTPSLNVNDIHNSGYSMYPALFAAPAANETIQVMTLSINVTIEGPEFPGNLTIVITGKQGGDTLFQSRAVTLHSQGPITVPVSYIASGVRQINGMIDWTYGLQGATAGSVAIGSTQLEIYLTPADPLRMWSSGVFVAPVRTIFSNLAGALPAPWALTDVIAATVNECFNSFYFANPKKYSGLPFYSAGGQFDFLSYWYYPQVDSVIRVPTPGQMPYGTDCTTQASLLCVTLGALGISSEMIGTATSMFGYLTPTNLVGWSGQCNNPYFEHTGQVTDGPYFDAGVQMETPPNSPKRAPWSYHQLVALQNVGTNLTDSMTILDATIGPYTGDHTLVQYLQQAVDVSTDVLPLYQGQAYATGASNFAGLGAVLSVSAIVPPSSPPATASAAAAAVTSSPAGKVQTDVPASVSQAAAKQNLTTRSTRIMPGPVSTLHSASFSDEANKTFASCQVYVENSASAASARYHEILSVPLAQPGDAWQAVPTPVGSSSSVKKDGSRLVWQHLNAVGVVSGNLPLSSLTTFAQALVSAWSAPASASAQAHISASVDKPTVHIGDLVTVTVQATGVGEVEFSCEPPRLRLIGRSADTLTFVAKAPGEVQITTFAPHAQTLLANQTLVTVKVVAADAAVAPSGSK